MRHSKYLVLLILLCFPFLFAGQNYYKCGGGFTNNCNTISQSYTGTGQVTEFGYLGAGKYYIATKFTVASPYSLCKFEFMVYKDGAPSMNVTAELWSDNAGTPGTLLATGETKNASTFPAATGTYTSFTLNYSLSATTYWLVLHAASLYSGGGVMVTTGTDGSGGKTMLGTSTPTWAETGASRQGTHRIYK